MIRFLAAFYLASLTFEAIILARHSRECREFWDAHTADERAVFGDVPVCLRAGAVLVVVFLVFTPFVLLDVLWESVTRRRDAKDGGPPTP